MKLLDTDFCIEVLRGSPRAIEQMNSFGEAVCTSTISAAELFYGACRSARADANLGAVRTFLSDLPLVTLAPSAAEL